MLLKTGGCAAGTGVEIAEGSETGGGTWGEISPLFPSTPSLFGSVRCYCLRGSRFNESDLVHSSSGLTADKSQSSLHPAKPLSIPPVIDKTRCHCANSCFGVQSLHLLLIFGKGLSGSYEYPDFDVLRDSVPHGRL